MVALVTATILGITLGSYMLLARSQNLNVVRSQAWNASLAIAEAGVEEALAHLNPGATTNGDRTANGWGSAVGGFFGPVSREFTNSSYQVKFTDQRFPVIYSTGNVVVPLLSATLTRVVRVETTNAPMFNAALVGIDGITMNGNSLFTDSYDSTNPDLSNNGRYDASRASTNGDVASMYGVVSVGNANVNGKVMLGSTATSDINANGIVSGGVTYDFNFEFPDVVLPTTTWLPQSPNTAKIDGVDYQYVFKNSGDYVLTTAPSSIYVHPHANVRIRILYNASPSVIRVAGQTGKLAIYMHGSTFSMAGNAVVESGVASNFMYFGMPTNTRVNIGGGATFLGTIYAPSAELRMFGGGATPIDFMGSIVCRSASLSGHYNFHFDEALRVPFSRGYVAVSWQEL
jgi:hypothetical protein